MLRDKSELVELVRREGYSRRDVPFRLSSGETSYDYVDGKRALADGRVLAMVCETVISLAQELPVEFDAVGGPTMGADAIVHGVALLTGVHWFSVRKETKSHGKQKLIEGAELSDRWQVLLVDDVVTTGSSMLKALAAVEDAGAKIVLAVSLVDRGEAARGRFEAKGIPYEPLMTYRDLEMDPVGGIGHIKTASR
ncbi:MAG: orotate phosphoribosyltransferase [Actinomycetota bacterium]|nr:orotate phosphoribosyltransferase [Actinomycetota bacterium]